MKAWLLISLALTAAAVAAALCAWNGVFGELPDPTPVHFNIRGEADSWVPRDRVLPYLLLPPGVMAVMILLGLVLPWLSPRKFDVESFRPTFEYVMLLMVCLFGYIHLSLLITYLRPDLGGIRLMVGGLILFFAFLGNVMGKVRRNFWMGVRTPWTLASDTVWNRTHRMTAWIWTPGSLILGIAILAGLPLEWSLVPFFLMILFPVPYSLYLYKKLEKQGQLQEEPRTQ
jgi:uncharacterized membrane protein